MIEKDTIAEREKDIYYVERERARALLEGVKIDRGRKR